LLGGAPRKIGVGLGEAQLGEPVHHLGPRECLGEEYHVGMGALDFTDHPLPEREGLGVWIVDAKHPQRSRRWDTPTLPPASLRKRSKL